MLGGRADEQMRTPQPFYTECKPIQIRLIENSSKELIQDSSTALCSWLHFKSRNPMSAVWLCVSGGCHVESLATWMDNYLR